MKTQSLSSKVCFIVLCLLIMQLVASPISQAEECLGGGATPVKLTGIMHFQCEHYEPFTEGMTVTVGGKVDDRFLVRVWELNPSGVKGTQRPVWRIRFKSRQLYFNKKGAKVITVPKRVLRLGEGIHYAMTIQPVGKASSTVSFSLYDPHFKSGIEGGMVIPTEGKDPFCTPYTAPRKGFRPTSASEVIVEED
ncbi:MAG: hypothetical protein AB7I98_13380 [Verrucomicrobiales bacterium]|nr:hypothetical protein [Verrucomicrobiae bacterium]MCP5554748.1 hypothetical protein [Akkermansiaceae bacterium]